MISSDIEIMAALVCCGDKDYSCSVCPFYIRDKDNDYCREDLCNAALDLIKRQKTKNNDLSKEIERLDKLLIKAKDCIYEIEYAVDRAGISNDRIDDAITEWYSFEKEPSKE